MMCVHREHRTGNCPDCRELEEQRPAMPLLWDGDQA